MQSMEEDVDENCAVKNHNNDSRRRKNAGIAIGHKHTQKLEKHLLGLGVLRSAQIFLTHVRTAVRAHVRPCSTTFVGKLAADLDAMVGDSMVDQPVGQVVMVLSCLVLRFAADSGWRYLVLLGPAPCPRSA